MVVLSIMKTSIGEATLIQHLNAHKIPFSREFRFHPVRKWRFDFIVGKDIAIEVEGGTWNGGRHTRGKAFEGDCTKYNTATLFGWRVFRFTTDMVKRGEAIDFIERALLSGEE